MALPRSASEPLVPWLVPGSREAPRGGQRPGPHERSPGPRAHTPVVVSQRHRPHGPHRRRRDTPVAIAVTVAVTVTVTVAVTVTLTVAVTVAVAETTAFSHTTDLPRRTFDGQGRSSRCGGDTSH